MKLRLSMLVAAVALLSTGCNKFFVVKDKLDAVKKVAVVSYVINPHIMLGTASADEAKWDVAAKNVASYVKVMTAGDMMVVPAEEVIASEKYKAMGKETVDGYYTAKGMRFFSDAREELEGALIPPDTAKALAEGLGVDGVIVIYDSWGLESYAFGFRGKTNNTYSFALFDKSGTKVYSDTIYGAKSEEGFALAGGVISTDVATWVLNNNQSFESALTTAKAKLGK